jgi:hypothetical protein
MYLQVTIFNTHIKEYWLILVVYHQLITNKRDTAQGIEIKIIVTLHGASAISKFEAAERLEENLKLFIIY